MNEISAIVKGTWWSLFASSVIQRCRKKMLPVCDKTSLDTESADALDLGLSSFQSYEQ
jgi:hypothetical protein